MTIGEVLGKLRPDFPDVTISKIRFLEAEGLVAPERSPSGYRKFSHDDVARLRFILTAQRDQYLPLRVIRGQLAALDRGLPPDAAATVLPTDAGDSDGPRPETFRRPPSELRLTRVGVAQAAGCEPEFLDELERYGLIAPRAGTRHYDGDALTVAKTATSMARFGFEPRHLRAMKSAADRETGLMEQVLAPLARGRGPEGRSQAAQAVAELAALSVRLHAALVRAALRTRLGL
jgi:DNA-binding transcriptional MerR regulator